MNKRFVFILSFILFVNHNINCQFTNEEQNALVKFRGLVKNIVYEDYMLSDDYLIPWLRARKLNLDRAKAMLEKNKNIINEDVSGVEKCVKFYHGGLDREGRPIVYAQVGSWDIRKCALAGKIPAMNRYTIKHFFEGPARVARSLRHPTTGANVTQYTLIGDLTGFNLRQGACLACLPYFGTVAYTLESYFPAAQFIALFVNSPQVFQVVLDFIKPILTPPTSNAITLFGHNKDEWTKGLDKYISKDQLPVMFGGQRVETHADRALYSIN